MRKFLLSLFALLVFVSVSHAAVPTQINVQGILKDSSGNLLANKTYSIVFSIYSASSGGSPLWTETQSVPVKDGIYNVQIGSVNTALDTTTVFDGKTRYLGIKLADESTEKSPRIALITVPYAFRATVADSVVTSSGTTGNVVELGPTSEQKTANQYGINVKSTYKGGVGIYGQGMDYSTGVKGQSVNGKGVEGISTNGQGGFFQSSGGYGVIGMGDVASGVYGYSAQDSAGFFESNGSTGVGVYGKGAAKGGSFEATGTGGIGVYGYSKTGDGVLGWAGESIVGVARKNGVYGKNDHVEGKGVYGRSENGLGVVGYSPNGTGVLGKGAVYGGSFEATGTNGVGIYAVAKGVDGFSGYFSGGKGLKIDTGPLYLVNPGSAPLTVNHAGEQGQIVYDSQYLYICIVANQWKRVALSSW
ncbi:hypothetical protein A2276_05775 [candidate division WOR-1 bacterium RIFOXYA12_FULL_43_27]|uniref:Uncharacterized protein n=1 Tax=candidate division WOR-1 bacterium RIFOXYC2_FULL_46_14 TaxID=1802587 RepID=A0A1F4U3K1_UNCSA|nr:MAG: hypothetical protein A2276_05775 [candidate division WOR-1 bacterium RIFOXYA12_FULL_43_27]OGC20172.1 MAG: hypothetical protein A2292_03775 [candidate division WOR-1 bacterium RIFOXYB2_FULL_46_45]OGC32091.1 MAG: hypothetical protein A2232_07675 [candidate division WOR-1 bacterium RIFOXYA2_FULL_46_56]OGC39492.1 MAG: hypothetical protein A2438_08035 [candidate division WOR-1 bacterium RIFOXYC2_FULL_46_14]